MDDKSPKLESPCTGICKLNEQNTCAGCFRSLAEIAKWGSSNLLEQRLILARCEGRKSALNHVSNAQSEQLVRAS